MKFDFPDEDLIAIFHVEKEEPDNLWKMYIDGAVNAIG